jgi:hypothetical protein
MKTYQHVARTAMLAIALTAGLSGCETMPRNALMLEPESLANRQLQTRRFEGLSEKDALAAGAAVLQDMGFSITESETSLGVVVGNKDRSAVSAGQQVGAVLVALLGGGAMATDKNQKITASLVTRPLSDDRGETASNAFLVRVTFARIVWNTQNQVTRAEQLNDVELYDGFFDKFSKSVFLEGHKI